MIIKPVKKKMCELLKRKHSVKHLKDVTREIIANRSCTAPLLKAFIMVRKLDLPKSKLPNKGTVAEAKAGVNNLISMAYEYLRLPNLLQQKVDAMNDELQSEDDEGDVYQKVSVIELSTETNTETEDASTMLSNDEWVKQVKKLFDPTSQIEYNKTTDDIKKKADILQQTLLFRMSYHIKRRIEDKSKHSHWAIKWSQKNMAQVSAIMILFNHVKPDLECMRDTTSTLLAGPWSFVSAETDKEKKLQGAYLYFDINDEKWVRSGKVTRRGFEIRHSEHEKKAAANRATSKFYSRYPSKEKEKPSSARKGFFENLSQYVAVGFAINKNVETKITKALDDGGVFDFTKEEREKIERNKRCNDIDLIAYQFELAYDLAISPSDNVSNNPGFESFLGVW